MKALRICNRAKVNKPQLKSKENIRVAHNLTFY